MNIKTWREARVVLVRDSLLAISTRLGYLTVEKINDLGTIILADGYAVTLRANKGPVGSRIAHILDVSVTTPEKTNVTRFMVDVLGQAQSRNCTFMEQKSVNDMTEEEFSGLCLLPEIYADVLASILANHYIKDTDE